MNRKLSTAHRAPMPLVTLQVVASALIVLAVLFFMWRLPHKGRSLYPWAPPLALLSTWLGLASLISSTLPWLLPKPDLWITLSFLLLDPAAIASGTLVLWTYRADPNPASQTITMQRLQARIAISLALASVALGYFYVFSHKSPFTPVGH